MVGGGRSVSYTVGWGAAASATATGSRADTAARPLRESHLAMDARMVRSAASALFLTPAICETREHQYNL